MRTDRRAPIILAALLSSTAAACASPPAERPAPVVLESAAAEGRSSDGNYALRFGGTGLGDIDRVKIPVDQPGRALDADIGATDTTIEFQMRARPGDNPAGAVDCDERNAWIYGNIIIDRDRFNQPRKFGLSIADGVIVFGLTGPDDEAVSMCSTSRVDDDRWHHIAVTRSVSTGAVTLFVDGRPEAQATGPAGDVSYPDGAVPEPACDGGRPCTRSDPYLVIGAEKHDAGAEYPSFRGLVDELRLSTTVRYPEPFTPPVRRFEPDADTAVLYHFDEGEGTVARDAVAAGDGASDGILRVGEAGPTWVPSDAPTGS